MISNLQSDSQMPKVLQYYPNVHQEQQVFFHNLQHNISNLQHDVLVLQSDAQNILCAWLHIIMLSIGTANFCTEEELETLSQVTTQVDEPKQAEAIKLNTGVLKNSRI